jgi:hypothetical protein
MKNLLIPTITFSALLLTACSSQGTPDVQSLEDRLQNPLFTERYSEELVDRMVEYKIQGDPILEDEDKVEAIESARKKWLEIARDARKKQREGFSGFLVTVKEQTKGEVLYIDNTLYTDTTFTVAPGPNVHIYISTVVDPRDVEFPDESAIDIGKLQSAYGAQEYPVPLIEDPQLYRSIVLWDDDLERLYGFAQVSK